MVYLIFKFRLMTTMIYLYVNTFHLKEVFEKIILRAFHLINGRNETKAFQTQVPSLRIDVKKWGMSPK